MVSEIKGLDLRKMKDSSGDIDVPEPLAGLTPRVIQIPIEYTNPDGKTHRAVVQSAILSGDERFKQAKMAVDMLMGATWDEMPPLYRQRAYMLSWLVFSFQSPPDWVLKWAQEDLALLQALYAEVETHERRYFLGSTKTGGERSPGENISITSPFAAGAPEE